jgi:hypothetical protein
VRVRKTDTIFTTKTPEGTVVLARVHQGITEPGCLEVQVPQDEDVSRGPSGLRALLKSFLCIRG